MSGDRGRWATMQPPEPQPGSKPCEATVEQYRASPILAGCAAAGYTEGQTIEMLWRAHEALLREHMRLVEWKPTPVCVVVTEKP